jgi:ABC transport system ATP-binding/permease protein
MPILSLQDVAKAYGEKRLFSGVTIGLEERDRLALIGVNGAGKSTLLRILARAEPVDAGSVTMRQGLRVQYVPQNPEFDDDHTLLEHLFAVDLEAAWLVRDYEAALRRMETAPDDVRAQQRLADLSHRLDAASAWDYEARAKAVLSRLDMRDFDARVGSLSGGYRKRLGLAHALLAEPDVLILDEPTNHLDTDTIDWLESWLERFPGAVVLVTHDRYFLDRVATRIVEIDAGAVAEFPANFSGYLERKAALAADAASSEERRQNRVRNELAWLRRGARARTTKSKARIKAAHALMDAEPAPARRSLTFQIQTRRLGRQIVELKDLTHRFDDRALFENFSHTFTAGERLGVIGPNGCGKSTLAGLITGRVPVQHGSVTVGDTVVFGYFDQESRGLNPRERGIDYVKRQGGELLRSPDGNVMSAERVLELFLFTPQMLYAPIEKLSGGERRRLQLVCTLMRDPNFLILDEPTNDLDIPTLQALEDFLDGFGGCLLVISHDRYFLDRTIDRVLAFDGAPAPRFYPGNYSLYAALRDERQAEASAATQASKPTATPPTPSDASHRSHSRGSRRLSYKEKRELESLEAEIAALESRLAELESALAAGGDYTELTRLGKEQADTQTRLDAAFTRWSELAELAEG